MTRTSLIYYIFFLMPDFFRLGETTCDNHYIMIERTKYNETSYDYDTIDDLDYDDSLLEKMNPIPRNCFVALSCSIVQRACLVHHSVKPKNIYIDEKLKKDDFNLFEQYDKLKHQNNQNRLLNDTENNSTNDNGVSENGSKINNTETNINSLNNETKIADNNNLNKTEIDLDRNQTYNNTTQKDINNDQNTTNQKANKPNNNINDTEATGQDIYTTTLKYIESEQSTSNSTQPDDQDNFTTTEQYTDSTTPSYENDNETEDSNISTETNVTKGNETRKDNDTTNPEDSLLCHKFIKCYEYFKKLFTNDNISVNQIPVEHIKPTVTIQGPADQLKKENDGSKIPVFVIALSCLAAIAGVVLLLAIFYKFSALVKSGRYYL